MSKCPSCGADVADGMKFCCECGARVPQDLECPACHAQSPIGTKFCPECGHRLSGTATEAVSSSSGNSKLAGDSFRHGVACHVCGRQMSIIEANTCIDCHQYACNEHYDKAAHKCQSCLNGNDEDALEDESASAAADEESQIDNSCVAGVTYQDVFNRVKEYLEDNGGYNPEVDDDDGTVSMVMDDDGMTYMYWDSIEDFLVAPWEDHHANFDQPGCAGIFEIAEFWDCKYEKLTRWAAVFVDNCGKLASVDISNKTPSALMEALDDAGIGIESSEDPDDCSDDDDSDTEEDTNDEEEEDSASGGHYSVVLKEAAENQGAMLRDLVEMTGKRLWPDISDMVSNLPAVVAEGLTRDEAAKYALALILDGAKAEVVADEDGDDDSDDGDDDWDDNDSDEDASDEEDSSSGDANHASRTCIVVLKDVGSDRNAVIREMRTLFNKTFGEAKKMIEKTPALLHLDCFRDEAEEIAAALEAVGATVEISDKDVGTVTSGSCSVVLKGIPPMSDRCAKAGISAEVAQLMGCMPANAWKMLDDLPLTVAENVSREEAEEIVAKFKKRKCVAVIVGGEEEEVSDDADADAVIDFDQIREYVESFKESVGCDDIVLPDASSFDKKWANLSGVLENSFDDLSLDPDDAIAILDCTVFGSAKNGVLIDKAGIYTNNDNEDLSGWMTWDDFKTAGHVKKDGSYDVHLYDDPLIGINVAGCGLSAVNTVKFFEGLLSLVRGEG